jgi:hypothetical protein
MKKLLALVALSVALTGCFGVGKGTPPPTPEGELNQTLLVPRPEWRQHCRVNPPGGDMVRSVEVGTTYSILPTVENKHWQVMGNPEGAHWSLGASEEDYAWLCGTPGLYTLWLSTDDLGVVDTVTVILRE